MFPKFRIVGALQNKGKWFEETQGQKGIYMHFYMCTYIMNVYLLATNKYKIKLYSILLGMLLKHFTVRGALKSENLENHF